jgi:hypothetical protein
MGNGKWAMGNKQWAIGNGQWAMGNEQWAMGNEQWAMGNGQWAMGSNQLNNYSQLTFTYLLNYCIFITWFSTKANMLSLFFGVSLYNPVNKLKAGNTACLSLK